MDPLVYDQSQVSFALILMSREAEAADVPHKVHDAHVQILLAAEVTNGFCEFRRVKKDGLAGYFKDRRSQRLVAGHQILQPFAVSRQSPENKVTNILKCNTAHGAIKYTLREE